MEALDGLPGVVCIADDVIIHGKDLEEHNGNLIAFMEHCRDNGIKLNREKLQLRISEVTFMGHRMTKDEFQVGKPVAYASRTLTETEKRYVQIEKEMLAVSFRLEKFHYYTYGRCVSVDIDHKPLVAIVMKALSKAPKRLQALLLRTQQYNHMLTYANM